MQHFDNIYRRELQQILNKNGYVYTVFNMTIKEFNRINEECFLTTEGVHLGCSVSSKLLNLRLNNAVRTWKMDTVCGFKLHHFRLSTPLYTNDEILLSELGNAL